MRRLGIAAICLGLLAASCVAGQTGVIEIGAIYPTGGSQGPGGIEEFRGVELAAELVNERGGVDGRAIRLRLEEAESREEAPGAVDRLAENGVDIVVGSYGSTISLPAANAAIRHGLLFWETGAVGMLGEALDGDHPVFRYPASGDVLGREAVAFVRDQLDLGDDVLYSVVYADDVYGRAVAEGALEEISLSGLALAADVPYDIHTADYGELAARVARAGTDVLVVVAYLEDGVALQRELVRQQVPLRAAIGTSSAYCMIAFGAMLGDDAIGLLASDKPDGAAIDPRELTPAGAQALLWARERYLERFSDEMTAPALTGFAGALALFDHVLPSADDLDAQAVARAARDLDVPRGELPDGGGLSFAGGSNELAPHVIWQWVERERREVVWPEVSATHEIVRPS
jgi:branched-chain amino acid transport system substrate-binding protein